MTALHRAESAVLLPPARLLDAAMPTLARLVFLAVLAPFFWGSAMTKLGEGLSGIVNLSVGAYVQILPRAMEAAGYDPTQLSAIDRAIVLAGTWGEFLLPALIVLGLFTRSASLGMIGFVIAMSVVDVTGHGADATTLGAWFDRIPDAKILDQRALWLMVLATIFVRGPGPISLDSWLGRKAMPGPHRGSGAPAEITH